MVETHRRYAEKLLSSVTALSTFNPTVRSMQLSPCFLQKHYPEFSIPAVGVARPVVLGWKVVINNYRRLYAIDEELNQVNASSIGLLSYKKSFNPIRILSQCA